METMTFYVLVVKEKKRILASKEVYSPPSQ